MIVGLAVLDGDMVGGDKHIQRAVVPIRRIQVFMGGHIEGCPLGEQRQAAGESGSDQHSVCDGAWRGGGERNGTQFLMIP